MRILLYVEPHPIRDTLVHFNDVARQFTPLLSCPTGYDVRMFANEATFATLKAELQPHSEKLIPTTQHEEEYLNDCLKHPWAMGGLPAWLDLMAGKGEAAERQLQMLRRIWNVFPFEIIVHWGENGAVTRFLDERPVTRVAMELGCTRPPFLNSLVMDPFGTNGSAILPRLGIEDIRNVVDNRPMSRHEALFGFSDDTSAPGYAMQFGALSGAMDARLTNTKTAFLPLQLFDDANLARFSSYDTLSDVVLDVVPRLADAGYLTIVKPHPASRHCVGSLYENAFARRSLLPWSDSVLWCDEETQVANARLFSLADLVITVNSSVGFEALYYDKPVVVLGDAVYKPRGMFPSLEDVLSGGFDRDAYLDSAGLLRRFMLGGYLQPHTIRQDAAGFCQRLALIHHAWQNSAADPARFAHDFWRACAPAQIALARSSMFWGISRPGVNEFGAAQAPAKTAAGADRSPDPASADGYNLPVSSINRIKAYWLAEKTAEWIEEQWATDAGQENVVTIGRMVDPDYYLTTHPDVRAARIDPVRHYAVSGLAEGRSPQPRLRGAPTAEVLAQLRRCAEQSDEGAPAAPSDRGDAQEFKAYQEIFKRLSKHVSTLDLGSFQDWLSSAWSDQAARARIIMIGGVVEPGYYLDRYSDIRDARVDPVRHYAWDGVTEGRSPRPGVEAADPEALLALLKSGAEHAETLDRSLAHPLPEDVEGRRAAQLGDMRTAVARRQNRIAVVAHLYYTDLVPGILDRLRAIPEPFDLFVTMPDWGTRRSVELVRAACPDALFYAAPNRGRDIGPFLDLLPILIDKGYDAVLKLQTKRGYFRASRMIPEFGEIWRNETFDALLGGAERVAAILDGFRSVERLNMVGPQPFLLPLDKYPYHDGGVLADRLIGAARPENGRFFAGTMFWVRPDCLRPLAELSLPHFAPEDGASDGALAHLVERMFGDAAAAEGGLLAGAPVDPRAPLDLDPAPLAISLYAYFTEREKMRGMDKAEKQEGALIW